MVTTSISVGLVDFDDADLLTFNNYDLDALGDMGAMDMVLVANQGGALFQLHCTFLVGTGESLVVNVTQVVSLELDEDGDLMPVDHEAVTGLSITVPTSAVMSVLTVCSDHSVVESQFEALESLAHQLNQ